MFGYIFLYHSLTVSRPLLDNFPVWRQKYERRYSANAIFSGNARIEIFVAKVHPCNAFSGRMLLPHLLIVNRNAYRHKSVLILVGCFLYLRNGHLARTAATAPEVDKHVSAPEVRQMPQFSVNIIEVGISSLLSYLNDMLGEKNILGFTAGERITPHIRYIGIESLSLSRLSLFLEIFTMYAVLT